MLPETGDDAGPGVVKTCRSHADLLEEMVCQRLSQDFQLVEKNVSAAGLRQVELVDD